MCRRRQGWRDRGQEIFRAAKLLWFYNNIHTYRYTTLGVSLHSADTGWLWRHASVASPTAADAHTLRHRKSALCMLFVFSLAVTEYLTTAALERKGLRWLTGWGDRPSWRGKRGYRQHWVGFPSSVKLSGPNQNYSESLGEDNTD